MENYKKSNKLIIVSCSKICLVITNYYKQLINQKNKCFFSLVEDVRTTAKTAMRDDVEIKIKKGWADTEKEFKN